MDKDEAEYDRGGSYHITPGQRAFAVDDSTLTPSADERQMAFDAIDESRNLLGRLERIIVEAQLKMNRCKAQMAEAEKFLTDNTGFQTVEKRTAKRQKRCKENGSSSRQRVPWQFESNVDILVHAFQGDGSFSYIPSIR